MSEPFHQTGNKDDRLFQVYRIHDRDRPLPVGPPSQVDTAVHTVIDLVEAEQWYVVFVANWYIASLLKRGYVLMAPHRKTDDMYSEYYFEIREVIW